MVILADLIQHEQFAREVMRVSLRKSVFWTSGVLQRDAEIEKKMLANIGAIFEFDYYNDLVDNEARISDDSATVATTDKISTDKDRAVGNYRNRSWGARRLTANLSYLGDPMTAIAGRVGAYWARQMDFTSISIVKGVMNANVANDASDMVEDHSGTPVTINLLLDTQQTMGDAQDVLGIAIVHSGVRNSLRKQGVTDRVYDEATGKFLYEALAGLRLVITDSVDSPSVSNYTSYIVGGAFMGYGEGKPKKPFALDEKEETGNGAGEESLWSRKHFCIHPYGHRFLSTTMASTSPTNAEFELATNWERTAERKAIPFAALISGV